jgi:hypothetical protein
MRLPPVSLAVLPSPPGTIRGDRASGNAASGGGDVDGVGHAEEDEAEDDEEGYERGGGQDATPDVVAVLDEAHGSEHVDERPEDDEGDGEEGETFLAQVGGQYRQDVKGAGDGVQ